MGFVKRHPDRNRATKTEEFRMRKLAVAVVLSGALRGVVITRRTRGATATAGASHGKDATGGIPLKANAKKY